jgi:hypothetical protein
VVTFAPQPMETAHTSGRRARTPHHESRGRTTRLPTRAQQKSNLPPAG